MLLLISGLGDENTKLEFGQIYEKNYRTMYYVALKILKNKEEAEDAVHGDRKSTRLNSSHKVQSRMPSSA